MGIDSEGLTISYSDTEEGTYADIGAFITEDVTMPEITWKTIEIKKTHYGSLQALKKKKPGEKDAGSLGFVVEYSNAIYKTLKALGGVEKWYKVTFSDESGERFQGYIEKIGQTVAMEDDMYIPISIVLQTEPTHFDPPTP